MDPEAKKTRCQCPQCEAWFTSGKARYVHQRLVHRTVRKKPYPVRKRFVPAKELYNAVPAV